MAFSKSKTSSNTSEDNARTSRRRTVGYSLEFRCRGKLFQTVLINDPEGYTEFYSVWHGYEVSLHCANLNEQNEPKPLTDDQIAVIMQFLTDMDFQKVIEEVEEPAT